MITIHNYIRARDLEQAFELNQNRKNRILGGMMWLKLGNQDIDTVIDLTDLALNTITETEDSFQIGAMVTLRQLETHDGFRRWSEGAYQKAVGDIVGVQFRNMATIGGSIWGRYGFSDVLTVFLSMDCRVHLYKGGLIPLEDFIARRSDRDILVGLEVKKTPSRFLYQSVRNQRTDFPVLTCALSQTEGRFRTVVGARPGRAVLVEDKEGLLLQGLTPDSIRSFAEYAQKSVPTGSNLRGSAQYRTHLVRVLVERGLRKLGGLV